jgi:hypothetical protein
VLGERFLPFPEEAHRKGTGFAKELVERRIAADRRADEGRVEGERDEGGDGQADLLSTDVDGHDGDAGRKAPHDRAKFVAGDHGGDLTKAVA